MRSPIRWITVVNGVLGLWLIVAPFVLEYQAIGRLNSVIIGTVIVVFVSYIYYRELNQKTINQRAAAIISILGGWLIVAPFVYGLSGVALWNSVCVGVVVSAFASYIVYAAPRIRRTDISPSSEDV